MILLEANNRKNEREAILEKYGKLFSRNGREKHEYLGSQCSLSAKKDNKY